MSSSLGVAKEAAAFLGEWFGFLESNESLNFQGAGKAGRNPPLT